MPTANAYSKFLDLLGSGELDPFLVSIRADVEQRRRHTSYENARQLQIGDFVRLTSIRPKYLQGVICKVVGFSGSRVCVDIPDDYGCGRYRGSRGCKVPVTAIERVDVAPEVSAEPARPDAPGLPQPDPAKKLLAVVIKDEGDDPNEVDGFVGPISFRYEGVQKMWRKFDPNRAPDPWFSLTQAEDLAESLGVPVETV
jgi:hypothetical protein